MSEDKQIEEMANILWHIPDGYYLNSYNDCKTIAECIYNDGGYRKASDVAREIFEEVENNSFAYGVNLVISKETFAELKKKYTKEIMEGGE